MPLVYEHVREAGPLLFVSGQTPQNASGDVPPDAGGQVEVAIGKIVALLSRYGLRLEDVVKMTYFLTDIGDLADVRGALDRLLPKPRPAATLAQVAALIDPRFRVEIEAIAVRS